MDCSGNNKQGRMLLTVLTVALVFFSADSELTAAEGKGYVESGPCWCKNWGKICYLSEPPLCQCDDPLLICPPTCKRCEKIPSPFFPIFYQCRDFVRNTCPKSSYPSQE